MSLNRLHLAGLVLMGVVAFAACRSHAGSTPGERSTATLGERFPFIAATATANAAIRAYHLDRSGHDCGVRASDQGFPTTVAPSARTTCLRDADRAAEQAFMIFTGRDGSGGSLLTSYRTEGHGSLSVLDLYADPSGKLRVTRWACAVPQLPVTLSIGFGGIGHQAVESLPGCRRIDG